MMMFFPTIPVLVFTVFEASSLHVRSTRASIIDTGEPAYSCDGDKKLWRTRFWEPGSVFFILLLSSYGESVIQLPSGKFVRRAPCLPRRIRIYAPLVGVRIGEAKTPGPLADATAPLDPDLFWGVPTSCEHENDGKWE